VTVEAIFAAMFRTHPFFGVARVLLLAAAGLVLAVGTAFAHERHVATNTTENYAISVSSAAHFSGGYAPSESPEELAVQAEPASHSSTPCSDDRAGGHFSGTCCTIACHAALTAPSIGLVGSPELPSPHVVAFVGILEGLSSDRTERPPKLG